MYEVPRPLAHTSALHHRFIDGGDQSPSYMAECAFAPPFASTRGSMMGPNVAQGRYWTNQGPLQTPEFMILALELGASNPQTDKMS